MIKNKINSIWLIAILSAIFIGCKKEDLTVGSNFQDKDGTFTHGVLTQDNLTISYSTLLNNDSLNTSLTDLLTVGRASDNQIGEVTANSFFEIALTSDAPDFGTNAVCDSVILKLTYDASSFSSRYQQGIGNTVLEVKELDEEIVDSITYVGTSSFTTKSDVLGQLSFDGSSHTSSYEEIHLSTDFCNRLMNEASGSTNDNFKSNLSGLALLSTSASTKISSFSVTSNETRIRLYYHNDTENSQYDFNIGDGLNEHVQISTDLSSGNFSGLTSAGSVLSSTNSSNTITVSSGTGLSPVITFDDLQQFFDTVGNVIVNQAIIELSIDENFYNEETSQVPEQLVVYESDANGKRFLDESGFDKILIPHAYKIAGSTPFPSNFNSVDRKYSLDLTYYFEEVLRKERDLTSLVIDTEFISSGENNSVRYKRAIIPTGNIQFKLVYSKL